ncbi:MAG TPA: MarR family transcriptional regulator [Roseiflexaceae bacterium]|nr:MarR family transcriptional regulator [Roseiflexaceae bacterium]
MSSPSFDRAQLLDAFNHQSQLLAATVVLFEQAAADRLSLHVAHLHCANLLRLTGPMTAGQLAELTGLTTGSVTSMVDRLERAGYVRRESDPHDRRRVVVQADAEAMEREIGPLYGSLAQATLGLLSGYSDEALALLVEHLTRNNALMLEEAVKLRHVAAQGQGDSGVELSGNEVAAPLGAVDEGHLVFATGSTRLHLSGAAAPEELFRAHFARLAPSVLVDAGLVKVFYRQALLNWSANSAEIRLNSRIPWRLDLVSSGAACSADLRAVELRAVDINSKAGTVELLLPPPTTHVLVRISGNASTVAVRLAAETAIEVRQGRGAANVAVDGQQLDATANTPYQTAGYAQAAGRYAFEITARLSTVTISRGASLGSDQR